MRSPAKTCRVLLLLWLPLLAGCQSLYFRTLNAGSETASLAVEYTPGLRLDVFRPAAGSSSAPVLLFFYGGRWQGGDRAAYAFVGRRFAEAGVLTLIADYRQFPEVVFPAFMTDAAQAVAWARTHAAAHGGDPDRLFVAGHSAGAHIAALLATDKRHLAGVGLRPNDLAGVIGIAGPYDFLPITDHDLQQIFGEPEDWPASQPVNFVDGDEPPFLLLHGDGDLLVWPRNSQRMAERLAAVGSAVDYREYESVGHVRILASLRFPKLAPTFADSLEFIRNGERSLGRSVEVEVEPAE